MALFTPCPHWAVVVQLWLMKILGIDIGGSGIKGAPVDLDEGVLAADRLRIPTPATSTPEAVAEVIQQIIKKERYSLGPVPRACVRVEASASLGLLA